MKEPNEKWRRFKRPQRRGSTIPRRYLGDWPKDKCWNCGKQIVSTLFEPPTSMMRQTELCLHCANVLTEELWVAFLLDMPD